MNWIETSSSNLKQQLIGASARAVKTPGWGFVLTRFLLTFHRLESMGLSGLRTETDLKLTVLILLHNYMKWSIFFWIGVCISILYRIFRPYCGISNFIPS